MRQTIKRWGNSPAVRIPAPMMALLNFGVDSEVEVNIVKDAHNVARLVIEPAVPQVTLEVLVAKITPENLHGEVELGEYGKEAW